MPEHGTTRQVLPDPTSELEHFQRFRANLGLDDNAPLTPNGLHQIMRLWQDDRRIRHQSREDQATTAKLKKSEQKELEKAAKVKADRPFEIEKTIVKLQEMQITHAGDINIAQMLTRRISDLNKQLGKVLAESDPKIARLMAGMGEAGTFLNDKGQSFNANPQPSQGIGPQSPEALPPPRTNQITRMGVPSFLKSRQAQRRALPPPNGAAAPPIGKQNALPTPATASDTVLIRDKKTGELFDYDPVTGKRTPARQ